MQSPINILTDQLVFDKYLKSFDFYKYDALREWNFDHAFGQNSTSVFFIIYFFVKLNFFQKYFSKY